MRILAWLMLVAMLSGCTTRNAYEFIRDQGRSRCYELPDTERDRCFQRTADDFDTFQRKRARDAEQPCPQFPEKVREICVSRIMEDLEYSERQREDTKVRPFR